MKKVICLLLLMLAVFCLAACNDNNAAEPDPSQNGADPNQDIVEPPVDMLTIGTVYNASVVNIRAEASTEGRIIDNTIRGQMFTVINYDDANTWHQISYRGEIGYISAEYLYVNQWEDNQAVTIATVKETVNIRQNPAETAAVLIGALKGEQYMVTGEDDGSGWVKVSYPDGMGYVSSAYVDVRQTTINEAVN